jgi:hypothetical protein
MKSWRQLFKSGSRQTPRADRIPLEMPLSFRHPEQSNWCQGTATNISSSGVLFRADQALKDHAAIQISYVLPATIAGTSGLPVNCKGQIVRTEVPANKEGTFLFAVKILDYYPSAQQ